MADDIIEDADRIPSAPVMAWSESSAFQ
jgi:hypothetical protein